MSLTHSIFIFSFIQATLNTIGATIIKQKLLSSKIISFKDFLLFIFDFKIIFAMSLIFISMFFSIKALSLGKFSLVIPLITGINFLLTILIGYLIFKDNLTLNSYIGITFILFGIYILGVEK